MIPAKHDPSAKHQDWIPHQPIRGFIKTDEEASLGSTHTVAIMEGAALVTYHDAPIVEVVGVRCLSLELPVVATWVAGDGTHDRGENGLSYALPPRDPPPAPILSAQEHAQEPASAE